jgi:DNA-binding response OmpR family regulator
MIHAEDSLKRVGAVTTGNGRKRVLVIDDNRIILEMVRDILEKAGYEVVTAESSLAANPHIYEGRPPHLILIDVMMPFGRGDDKVAFLKERETSRDIPVVLMSSRPGRELSKIASTCGADGYISKPFECEELLAAVEHHL